MIALATGNERLRLTSVHDDTLCALAIHHGIQIEQEHTAVILPARKQESKDAAFGRTPRGRGAPLWLLSCFLAGKMTREWFHFHEFN